MLFHGRRLFTYSFEGILTKVWVTWANIPVIYLFIGIRRRCYTKGYQDLRNGPRSGSHDLYPL
jgi:hypothetical protein